MISGWFQGAPIAEIWRRNLAEWVAWAMYEKHLEQLHPLEDETLEGYIDHVVERWGLELQPGYNPALKGACMRISLDPLRARFHPLLMYAVTWACRFLGGRALQGLGFEKKRVSSTFTGGSEVDYWIRQASHGGGRPLCFMHGVGIGQAATVAAMPGMIREFGDDSAIILPEYDSISMVAGGEVPPSREAVVAAVAQMIDDAWEGGDATFVSHSWGSVQLAWLLKVAPERVGAALFLDPICFLLHLPNVCYAFAYQTAWWHAPSVLRQYAGASELGLANTIHRHFCWHENALYLEEIPAKLLDEGRVRVVMGSEDSLVPAEKIQEYLTQWDESRRVRTMLVRGFDHVEWASSAAVVQEVLQMLKVMHQPGQQQRTVEVNQDYQGAGETCLLLGAATAAVRSPPSAGRPPEPPGTPLGTPVRRAG